MMFFYTRLVRRRRFPVTRCSCHGDTAFHLSLQKNVKRLPSSTHNLSQRTRTRIHRRGHAHHRGEQRAGRTGCSVFHSSLIFYASVSVAKTHTWIRDLSFCLLWCVWRTLLEQMFWSLLLGSHVVEPASELLRDLCRNLGIMRIVSVWEDRHSVTHFLFVCVIFQRLFTAVMELSDLRFCSTGS